MRSTMSKEIPKEEHGNPVVEFLYLNTNAEVKFHSKWSDKLSLVWDHAYNELKEARKPNDVLECQNADSLAAHLDLALAQFRDPHICQAPNLQLRSATCGAKD